MMFEYFWKDFWKTGMYGSVLFAVLCFLSFLEEPSVGGFLSAVFFIIFAFIFKAANARYKEMEKQKQIG